MKRNPLLILLLLAWAYLMGCAVTPIRETQKPEHLFGDKVERELAHLSRINPILAEELRKLPELKRGLDEKGLAALNRIVSYYIQSSNPDETKDLFDRILSIGKKERRKFSAPLQALFWLAEGNEIPLGENLLRIHSKEKYRGFNRNIGEDEEVITFVYNVWQRTYHTEKWVTL